MKVVLLAILFALCGCGTYAGLDTWRYFPEGLPVEVAEQGVEIVPPEVLEASVSIFSEFLGPYKKIIGIVPGVLMLLGSFFVKRKKGKKDGRN